MGRWAATKHWVCLASRSFIICMTAFSRETGTRLPGTGWFVQALPVADADRLPRETNRSASPVLHVGRTSAVAADIVVGADGVASAVRQALCEQGVAANQSRFADRRPIVYRVLAIPTAEGDRTDLNYSARNDNVIVEALPNVEGSLLGVILFRPTDERIQGLNSGAEAKAVFQELFPEWPTPLIPDHEWEAFARRRTRELPQFAFAGPQLSLDGKSCLLGDAIHSVKPFFGLGLNSGFEDISVLDECLEEAGCDPHEALQLYSRRRAPEAKCLVECQRRFDQPTDLRFALAFVLPLVLDSIFSKALPAIFGPSILALFQDGELSFTAARRRKRRDRALQVLLLLGFLSVSAIAAGGAVRLVCHLLRRAAPHHALAWLHLHHELL
ncbi:kmo [Symbiodinium sp. CCMP2592]|nr:kmo [Symbiodinium sp. CCMP2592]